MAAVHPWPGKARARRVIPGFGLSLGYTLAWLGLIVLIPLVGVFAAVPYCIDLIGGPYLETRDEVCKAFRPKSAVRAPRPPA